MLVMSCARAVAAAALVVLACAVAAGCRRTPTGSGATDLLALSREAVKRPESSDPSVFSVREVVIGAEARRALIVPQPARIVWQVRIPGRARLTGAFGVFEDAGTGRPVGGRLYLGISDQRHFARLIDLQLPGGADTPARWEPLDVDLGRYGGWQWSLFYRPWETTWDLIATITGPASGRAALADLAIGTRR